MDKCIQRILGLSAALLANTLTGAITVFELADHPDGNQTPPTYGLRLDGLDGNNSKEFTFSFGDSSPFSSTEVNLFYDDVANTIRIFGEVYGGEDIGTIWNPNALGRWEVDFTYSVNVTGSVTATTSSLIVDRDSPNNKGTITFLEGTGFSKGETFNLTDEGGPKNNMDSFLFLSDGDRLIGDDSTIVGRGWLNHAPAPQAAPTKYKHHVAASDWIFIVKDQGIVIPEPSTYTLIFAIFAGFIGLSRRRCG
ncbi:MAG: PEP-CTERM sorting domain-containing protein [Verrucomicrobiota bacterium]